MPEKPAFFGTYFDRDSVLRWTRWTRVVAWAGFAVYVLQYVYETGINLYNSFINGYPIDWLYLVFNLSQPFQGAMILMFLQLLASAVLILLDIEDNTRRAARK
ncbi:MAG: hypothetical protein RBS68_08655 [Anaerolineales bacterium]|nr:hypothetical protein [Anaerolineales bacterium]